MSARTSLIAIGLALVLAACPGEDAPMAPTPTGPAIELSTTTATFSATAGDNDPADQTITITNGGTGTLSDLRATVAFAPGGPTAWLSGGFSARTAPAGFQVRPRTSILAPGTYNANVTFSSPVASATKVLAVTVSVATAAAPVIVLSYDNHTFYTTQTGSQAPSSTVNVMNGGTGTLSGLDRVIQYGVGRPGGWLTATFNQTTAPAVLTLSAARGSLTPALYFATVRVTSPNASQSSRDYRVGFFVQQDSGAAISIDPPLLEFSDTVGGWGGPYATPGIYNAGQDSLTGLAATVQYAAGGPTGWINLNMRGTRAPTNPEVRPVTGDLVVGTYAATIIVTSPRATNSPVSVPVTFRVHPKSGGPAIGVMPRAVAFTVAQGGAIPAAQVVNIVNNGGGALNGLGGQVVYTSGQPSGWLQGSLGNTAAPTTLTLRPRTVLAAGTYTANVTLTATTAPNATSVVAVAYTVTP